MYVFDFLVLFFNEEYLGIVLFYFFNFLKSIYRFKYNKKICNIMMFVVEGRDKIFEESCGEE